MNLFLVPNQLRSPRYEGLRNAPFAGKLFVAGEKISAFGIRRANTANPVRATRVVPSGMRYEGSPVHLPPLVPYTAASVLNFVTRDRSGTGTFLNSDF